MKPLGSYTYTCTGVCVCMQTCRFNCLIYDVLSNSYIAVSKTPPPPLHSRVMTSALCCTNWPRAWVFTYRCCVVKRKYCFLVRKRRWRCAWVMLSYRWARPSVSVKCMLRTTGEVVVGGNSQGLCRCQGVHEACTHTHMYSMHAHTQTHTYVQEYIRDCLSWCFDM